MILGTLRSLLGTVRSLLGVVPTVPETPIVDAYVNDFLVVPGGDRFLVVDDGDRFLSVDR